LTGINLGAWGAAISNDFVSGKLSFLIDQILTETPISRLRISSLGVEFVTDALIDRFKNPRVHAYVHLSVQSGSDRILTAMGRHYNRTTLLDRLLDKYHVPAGKFSEQVPEAKKQDRLQCLLEAGKQSKIAFEQQNDKIAFRLLLE